MKQILRTMTAAAALFAVLAVVNAEWSQAADKTDHPQIRMKDGIGSYLTDGNGATLYYFKKDTRNQSACSGPCTDRWPAYYAESIKAPAGTSPGDFGAFTRTDGSKQSTFRGRPLYYFAGDKKPGDAHGQGFKDVWFVLKPHSIEPAL